MARGRGWRRWRGDVRLAKVLADQNFRSWYDGYDPKRHNALTYKKKTSSTETVEVQVLGESHYRDFLRHNAKLKRDNATLCSCCSCCNPRKSGIGNAREVLSINEGIALMAAVEQLSRCDAPNSTCRSRKFGASTHAKIENYYDQRD